MSKVISAVLYDYQCAAVIIETAANKGTHEIPICSKLTNLLRVGVIEPV